MPRYFKYELDWGPHNGGKQIVEGPTPWEAMTLAGYGGGAARALKGWRKLTPKEAKAYAEAQSVAVDSRTVEPSKPMTLISLFRSWFSRLTQRKDAPILAEQFRALYKLKNRDAGVKW